MNNRRRDKLRKARELITNASEIIEAVQDEEQDSMNNIPEALQSSERYEDMEQAYDALDMARDHCEQVVNYIRVAIH